MNSSSQGAAIASLRGGGDERESRNLWAPLAIAASSFALMMLVATVEGLPIHDPDARYVGSSAALIGVVSLIFLAIDVLRRGFILRRESDLGVAAFAVVFRERWLSHRGVVVFTTLASFCVTYIAYRNLKSYVPSVTDGNFDEILLDSERTFFLGQDPADLLHSLLGTGIAAEFLSFVYVAFFMFIPLSIGYALIWSDQLRPGVWYVSALSLCWILGAISYYVLPALGPVYADPATFSDLPDTAVSRLQSSLAVLRADVLADPAGAATVQSIAAFASLHTAILIAAVGVAELVQLPRIARICLRVALGLTLLATVYFGWHYLIDDVAGAAIGTLAIWVGARMLGLEPAWREAPVLAGFGRRQDPVTQTSSEAR